ncbi:MAG TPA: glutamate racemase [Candidatus Saccharimonadales bacterium]|nr:glutamate racemase [Candidatus Saccharimonadales bacterium]
MKIGVFDSGIGGLSVARAIEKALPEHEMIFVNDAEHVPYGSKKPDEILGYVVPILQKLVDGGCQVIVIACNTVTTTLITELRAHISVPLVAVEPMVKPAAEQTRTGVIAVCATPATLASQRYGQLKAEYAKDITVVEPDCGDWAFMIEHQQVDERAIQARIQEVLDKRADVIVLACTHYHWIEELIKRLAKDRADIIQPEQALIRQLKRVLTQLA